MPHHDGALRTARIILAGAIVASGKCRAIRLGAGEDIVPVRSIAATVSDLALFVQNCLLGHVVRTMQLSDVFRYRDAFCVSPRSLADAVAGIHTVVALRRQIGAP